MIDNLSIVTFKWKKNNKGYQLKAPVEYTSEHVNILYHSIKRNVTIPFDFICVTDDPLNLDPKITYVPLWDTYRDLGGCFTRLYMFSNEVRHLFGNKFLCIDLDCVIVGNIDNILLRPEDFVINRYYARTNLKNQMYNGALILMKTGSRINVWNKFKKDESPQILEMIKEELLLVGSDQAWIHYVLGTNQSTFTQEDGIYDYSLLRNKEKLPENARIVFFHGALDPSLEKDNVKWIKDHWHK